MGGSHAFWATEEAKKLMDEYFDSKRTLSPLTIAWMRTEIFTRFGLKFSKSTVSVHLHRYRPPIYENISAEDVKPPVMRWEVPPLIDLCSSDEEDNDATVILEDIPAGGNSERECANSPQVQEAEPVFHRRTYFLTPEGRSMLRKYSGIGKKGCGYDYQKMAKEIERKHKLKFSKSALYRKVAIYGPHELRKWTLQRDQEQQTQASQAENPTRQVEQMRSEAAIDHVQRVTEDLMRKLAAKANNIDLTGRFVRGARLWRMPLLWR